MYEEGQGVAAVVRTAKRRQDFKAPCGSMLPGTALIQVVGTVWVILYRIMSTVSRLSLYDGRYVPRVLVLFISRK